MLFKYKVQIDQQCVIFFPFYVKKTPPSMWNTIKAREELLNIY